MLRPEQVSNAIKRGVNQRLADGSTVVKNGKGFWVYQFRDGSVIRSKGLGAAARVTLAQARRAREAFALARRQGAELPGLGRYAPGGDKFAVAADAYLSDQGAAVRVSERHLAAMVHLQLGIGVVAHHHFDQCRLP